MTKYLQPQLKFLFIFIVIRAGMRKRPANYAQTDLSFLEKQFVEIIVFFINFGTQKWNSVYFTLINIIFNIDEQTKNSYEQMDEL